MLLTLISPAVNQCLHPSSFSNGQLHYTVNTYGSIINYTCHEGYINHFICVLFVCDTLCQRKQLTALSVYFHLIWVSCPAVSHLHRYKLIGAHSAECLANGSWSAPVPECKRTKPITPKSQFLSTLPSFCLLVKKEKTVLLEAIGGSYDIYYNPPPEGNQATLASLVIHPYIVSMKSSFRVKSWGI